MFRICCVSVRLFVHPSFWLSVSQPGYLFVRPSLCLNLSVCLPFLFASLCVCLSDCQSSSSSLSTRLSLSVCLNVHLSV